MSRQDWSKAKRDPRNFEAAYPKWEPGYDDGSKAKHGWGRRLSREEIARIYGADKISQNATGGASKYPRSNRPKWRPGATTQR